MGGWIRWQREEKLTTRDLIIIIAFLPLDKVRGVLQSEAGRQDRKSSQAASRRNIHVNKKETVKGSEKRGEVEISAERLKVHGEWDDK